MNKQADIFKVINYLLAFLSIGLGVLLPFFKGAEVLPVFEKTLYCTIFISFGLAFILFSLSYNRIFQRVSEKRNYFVAANIVLLVLWIFLAFLFVDNFQEHIQQRKELSETKARIYKIDPEGYRKKRTLYYTFEYNGQRYTGKKVNPTDSFNIGDSVNITFSTAEPERNRLTTRN